MRPLQYDTLAEDRLRQIGQDAEDRALRVCETFLERGDAFPWWVEGFEHPTRREDRWAHVDLWVRVKNGRRVPLQIKSSEHARVTHSNYPHEYVPCIVVNDTKRDEDIVLEIISAICGIADKQRGVARAHAAA